MVLVFILCAHVRPDRDSPSFVCPYDAFETRLRKKCLSLHRIGPCGRSHNVIETQEFFTSIKVCPNLARCRAPFTASGPTLPKGAITNISGTNYLVMQVIRPIGRLDIVYGAEVSGELLTWLPAVQVGLPANNGDGTETITFRDTQSTVIAGARFIRFRITKL